MGSQGKVSMKHCLKNKLKSRLVEYLLSKQKALKPIPIAARGIKELGKEREGKKEKTRGRREGGKEGRRKRGREKGKEREEERRGQHPE
jgi:hypothetical protein